MKDLPELRGVAPFAAAGELVFDRVTGEVRPNPAAARLADLHRRREARKRAQRERVAGWDVSALDGFEIPDEANFTPESLRRDFGAFVRCGARVALMQPVVRVDGGYASAGAIRPVGGYCGQSAICVQCAEVARRARFHRVMRSYDRFRAWLRSKNRVVGNEYLVTLTVKNTETRQEGERALKQAFRRFQRLRGGEWERVVGHVAAYECTRNKRTGEYHPHVHILAVTGSRLDFRAEPETTEVRPGTHVHLSRVAREWWECTGRESWVVDVKPLSVGNRSHRRAVDREGRVTSAESALRYVLEYAQVGELVDSPEDYAAARIATYNKRYFELGGFFRGLGRVMDALEGVAPGEAAEPVGALRCVLEWSGIDGYEWARRRDGRPYEPEYVSPQELDDEGVVVARSARIRGWAARVRSLLHEFRRSGEQPPPWVDVPIDTWGSDVRRSRPVSIRYFLPRAVLGPAPSRDAWYQAIDGVADVVDPWLRYVRELGGRPLDAPGSRVFIDAQVAGHDDVPGLLAVMLGHAPLTSHALTDPRMTGYDPDLYARIRPADFLAGALGHEFSAADARRGGVNTYLEGVRRRGGRRPEVAADMSLRASYWDRVRERGGVGVWDPAASPICAAAVAAMIARAAARSEQLAAAASPQSVPVLEWFGIPAADIARLDSFARCPVYPLST